MRVITIGAGLRDDGLGNNTQNMTMIVARIDQHFNNDHGDCNAETNEVARATADDQMQTILHGHKRQAVVSRLRALSRSSHTLTCSRWWVRDLLPPHYVPFTRGVLQPSLCAHSAVTLSTRTGNGPP